MFQRILDNGAHSFELGSAESETYENCERHGKSNTGRLLKILFFPPKNLFLTRSFILIRNVPTTCLLLKEASGIDDEDIENFNKDFARFDKDKDGQLSVDELRGLMMSLGKSGDNKAGEKEFQRILKQVDPSKSGMITANSFIDFMIQEDDDAMCRTSADLMENFKILAGDKDYITEEDIRREMVDEQADYCVDNMPKFKGEGEGALDYKKFSKMLFKID
jgi:hypothetical protein